MTDTATVTVDTLAQDMFRVYVKWSWVDQGLRKWPVGWLDQAGPDFDRIEDTARDHGIRTLDVYDAYHVLCVAQLATDAAQGR